MRNERKKNSPLKKKDKILFYTAMGLLVGAAVFFAASCVLFVKSNGDSDHSRFFTACILLFCGGISALGASACLLFTPLMQSRRNGVCPYCGAKVSKKSAFCPLCGKLLKKAEETKAAEDSNVAETAEVPEEKSEEKKEN